MRRTCLTSCNAMRKVRQTSPGSTSMTSSSSSMRAPSHQAITAGVRPQSGIFIGVGMPVSGFRVSSPDAFLNVEVSRLHAKLVRNGNGSHVLYRLIDMRSTCGTYLNGDPIPVPDDLGGSSEEECARALKSGDFFSLGPSAVNLFLFFQK